MEPPPPRTRKLLNGHFDEIVDLQAGICWEKKCFAIYKGSISFFSDHSEKAVNQPFKETTSRIAISKEETAQTTAEIFAISYGQVDIRDSEDDFGPQPKSQNIAEIWVFGDGPVCPLVQSEVMDALLTDMEDKWQGPFHLIKHIYESTSTTADAELRRAMAEAIALAMAKASTRPRYHALDDVDAESWTVEMFIEFTKFFLGPPDVACQTESAAVDPARHHVWDEDVECAERQIKKRKLNPA
ncbi:hypothetical protein MBLNU459_g1325t1 [Dothideomycetes sp. NU459]